MSAARARRRRWIRSSPSCAASRRSSVCALLGYYYVVFARLIDERLHGERERVLPRVYARPFELRRGQALTEQQLVDRLNDLGYAQRPRRGQAGRVRRRDNVVSLIPRGGDVGGKTVRAVFQRPAVAKAGGAAASRLPTGSSGSTSSAVGRRESVTLDPPLLTALMSGEREKRRQVTLATIPPHVVHAVLAIEDRRFYEHPGIDPIRMVGALVTNLVGDKPYLVGGSTITQQLVKNIFLGAGDREPAARSRCKPRSCSSSSWRSCSSAARRRTRSSSCT